MASLRLRYVQGIVDRHGHPRFYFRRPGFARVTLPGLPWSQEFMDAYQRAMSLETAALKVGSEKVKSRSIHALAIAYFDSRAFNDLKPNTQSVYRYNIERFCRDTDGAGQRYGDKSAVARIANTVPDVRAY